MLVCNDSCAFWVMMCSLFHCGLVFVVLGLVAFVHVPAFLLVVLALHFLLFSSLA